MKVPPTQKTEMEKIQKALDHEAEEWNRLGMSANGIRHDAEGIWMLKLQVQAMMNALLQKGLLTEDDVNLQFKQLMLNDMQVYREQAEKQRRDSLVPDIKLLGP